MLRSSFAVRFFMLLAFLVLSGIVVCDDARADDAQVTQWEQSFENDILPIIREKCVECHQGKDADGGFDATKFDTGKLVSEKMDMWDEVGKRVRLKEMPPEGSPQLNDEQKGKFHRWLDSRPQQDLCSQLATDETQAWYRGFVMSRRLTRTEYLQAMNDLVGIAVDPQLEIPSDGSGGEGFDTNGDTLYTSPIHIEQYLAIASQMIDAAVPVEEPAGDDEAAKKARERRQQILIVLPNNDLNETDAAKTIINAYARRAWRRPIEDSETSRLLTLFERAKSQNADFVTAIREPLKAILVSPNFLFVVEAESEEGGVQRLTPHQLATRLALFLWSSVPDEELLAAADANQLDTKDQVLTQVRRMLASPKSRAIGENFGLQWLGLTSFLTSVRPDQEVYPEFNPELASDLREEAIQFVSNVFREDRPLLDLIDSKYAVLNGRLAKHYGVDLPNDAPWQQVELADRRRGGVITLGAALMTSSYPRRTSPVLRGRWILEEVLGAHVPPPPPNVPALEEATAEKAMTLRERLEVHRKNPDCAACHNRMDPLGFGLENFDGLGRWRDKDHDFAIDASGKLPSGESFAGPEELKQILLRRSGEFEYHLVKKMLGFALGRELNKLNAENHRASAVIETIATSYPFQHRYFKAAVQK
jgi:mono/diheme cytochrome c family protein